MPTSIGTPEGDSHYSMQWQVNGDTLTASIRPYHQQEHSLAIEVLIHWLKQQDLKA